MPPHASMQADSKREVLMRIPLFRDLTRAELDAVAAHAVVHRQQRGAAMLRKGEPATGMIVLLQGRVRISLLSEDGREVIVRILGPGEVLGEISLLDGQPRSADVTALEDCVLLQVERAHFLSMLRGSTDLCLRLMASLCERVRRTSASLEEAVLLDLPARLWLHLRRMAAEHGVATARGTLITVRLSQGEIAALVGASREAVNRQLRSWESEGRIASENGRLILTGPLSADARLTQAAT